MTLRYIKEPGKPTELMVDGSMLEVTAEIGKMIQQIWYKLNLIERLTFRLAIKVLVEDDSPVWSSPSGITVDASELLRHAKEKEP